MDKGKPAEALRENRATRLDMRRLRARQRC